MWIVLTAATSLLDFFGPPAFKVLWICTQTIHYTHNGLCNYYPIVVHTPFKDSVMVTVLVK